MLITRKCNTNHLIWVSNPCFLHICGAVLRERSLHSRNIRMIHKRGSWGRMPLRVLSMLSKAIRSSWMLGMLKMCLIPMNRLRGGIRCRLKSQRERRLSRGAIVILWVRRVWRSWIKRMRLMRLLLRRRRLCLLNRLLSRHLRIHPHSLIIAMLIVLGLKRLRAKPNS